MYLPTPTIFYPAGYIQDNEYEKYSFETVEPNQLNQSPLIIVTTNNKQTV